MTNAQPKGLKRKSSSLEPTDLPEECQDVEATPWAESLALFRSAQRVASEGDSDQALKLFYGVLNECASLEASEDRLDAILAMTFWEVSVRDETLSESDVAGYLELATDRIQTVLSSAPPRHEFTSLFYQCAAKVKIKTATNDEMMEAALKLLDQGLQGTSVEQRQQLNSEIGWLLIDYADRVTEDSLEFKGYRSALARFESILQGLRNAFALYLSF